MKINIILSSSNFNKSPISVGEKQLTKETKMFAVRGRYFVTTNSTAAQTITFVYVPEWVHEICSKYNDVTITIENELFGKFDFKAVTKFTRGNIINESSQFNLREAYMLAQEFTGTVY